MIQQIRQSRRAIKVQKEQLAALIDNSFDAGVQRRIGEAILQKNTTANFEAAVEYNQEPFIRIARLYINVETARSQRVLEQQKSLTEFTMHRRDLPKTLS
ncbi:hypothetical protein RO3G_12389 [Rhizopus delemar RA 99-880]|uniref:Uncharacterized protein n=1 Tax=Rhizopus delemar (strain RA 99-880 / ATCC MYA-4621 / FGSC 9543 / NRRL 43880) TaxID=246409 RepID=I1CGU8_RHIO9|nr:hypothetical protein RO3G_12389 [Rhizopus delemar RA 99-880]|eukprot:EIE87678.1 hypothetical protein RO3G_12389 [Rhizopus delemar RA 99-880]